MYAVRFMYFYLFSSFYHFVIVYLGVLKGLDVWGIRVLLFMEGGVTALGAMGPVLLLCTGCVFTLLTPVNTSLNSESRVQ